jgi:hypothetical protein
MRIVNVHHAWNWPAPTRKATMTLVVIVVLFMVAAAMAGHGTAALATIFMAALAVIVEELVRAALRHWLRTV